MTHRRATNYAKNYCNRTLIVKVIVENVVTCFLGGHGVRVLLVARWSRSTLAYSTSDPVNTWMGDCLTVNHLGITSHLGQLSLSSFRGR